MDGQSKQDLTLRAVEFGTNRASAVRAILEQLDDWYADRPITTDVSPDPKGDEDNDLDAVSSSGADTSVSETVSEQVREAGDSRDSDTPTKLGGETPDEGVTPEPDSAPIETSSTGEFEATGDRDTRENPKAEGHERPTGIFSYALQNVRGDLGR